MLSSGVLHRMALVRTDISEERITSIIWVRRIVELGTTLAVSSNRSKVFLRSVLRLLVTANVLSSPVLVSLIIEAIRSSETSVLTGVRRRNNPEDGILFIPVTGRGGI
jgi:hypothetical protein